MYKLYFKQAIQMLKQNKFISAITIIGTAIAIMMIMVIIVTDSIQKIDVSPEINRQRTMYLQYQEKRTKDSTSMNSNGAIAYEIYKNYLSDIKTPELVSLYSRRWQLSRITIPEDKKNTQSTQLKYTDANFWKIMSFNFFEGKPYTEEDFNSGLKKAVVSQSMARKLYGNQNALGKTILIESDPFTIVGIVKDISPILKHAYSDIYIPYTTQSSYEKSSFMILFLAKNTSDFDAIYEEVRKAERKYNSVDQEWNLRLFGPYPHNIHLVNTTNAEPNVSAKTRKTIFILSILLLVPAINLSSFSMSRIKKRTEEIGIRKAFGAKKYTILVQVLYENFITSLIGGIIGLILSYAVVIWLKQWLLNVKADSTLPIETFVSIPVFVAVFFVCLLINLISAGIPAYRAAKLKIVDSLNRNNL